MRRRMPGSLALLAAALALGSVSPADADVASWDGAGDADGVSSRNAL